MNDKAQYDNNNNDNYSNQDRLGSLELNTQIIQCERKREIKLWNAETSQKTQLTALWKNKITEHVCALQEVTTSNNSKISMCWVGWVWKRRCVWAVCVCELGECVRDRMLPL